MHRTWSLPVKRGKSPRVLPPLALRAMWKDGVQYIPWHNLSLYEISQLSRFPNSADGRLSFSSSPPQICLCSCSLLRSWETLPRTPTAQLATPWSVPRFKMLSAQVFVSHRLKLGPHLRVPAHLKLDLVIPQTQSCLPSSARLWDLSASSPQTWPTWFKIQLPNWC